ncbi:hypothetical protein BH23VER1_BH23VER1_21590 [soil metagenome]
MSILITLLTVLLIFACVLMVLVILMQRPKQEGLGAAFGGGMPDSMFGAQTTNVLQRGTIYFAVFYFVVSTTLAVLVAKHHRTDETLGEGLRDGAVATEPADPTLPEGASPTTTTGPAAGGDATLDLDSPMPESDTFPGVDLSLPEPATGEAPDLAPVEAEGATGSDAAAPEAAVPNVEDDRGEGGGTVAPPDQQ